MISHVQSQRFLLIDPSLRDRRGHNLDYARLVIADAKAAGYDCTVFAHANSTINASELGCPIDRYFTRAHTDPPVADTAARLLQRHFGDRTYRFARGIKRTIVPPNPTGDANFKLSRARVFLSEIASLFAQLVPCPRDRVFFPNLLWSEAAGLTKLLDSGDFAGVTDIQILMRYDPPVGELAEQAMAEAGKIKAATWLADTDELVESYTSLLHTLVLRAPVPLDGPALRRAANGRAQPDPVVIVALGESRREKGFLLLPDLIARVVQQDSYVRFEVQTSLNMPGGETGIRAAIARLQRMEGPNLALLPPELLSDQFARILGASHVLLMPYEASSYSKRSSGLLLHGLAAGLWIVAPESTPSLVTCIERNARPDQAILCNPTVESYVQGIHEAITRARKGSPGTWPSLVEELIPTPWTRGARTDSTD